MPAISSARRKWLVASQNAASAAARAPARSNQAMASGSRASARWCASSDGCASTSAPCCSERMLADPGVDGSALALQHRLVRGVLEEGVPEFVLIPGEPDQDLRCHQLVELGVDDRRPAPRAARGRRRRRPARSRTLAGAGAGARGRAGPARRSGSPAASTAPPARVHRRSWPPAPRRRAPDRRRVGRSRPPPMRGAGPRWPRRRGPTCRRP